MLWSSNFQSNGQFIIEFRVRVCVDFVVVCLTLCYELPGKLGIPKVLNKAFCTCVKENLFLSEYKQDFITKEWSRTFEICLEYRCFLSYRAIFSIKWTLYPRSLSQKLNYCDHKKNVFEVLMWQRYILEWSLCLK